MKIPNNALFTFIKTPSCIIAEGALRDYLVVEDIINRIPHVGNREAWKTFENTTVEFVDRNWKPIEVIAGALLKLDTLTYDDVIRVLDVHCSDFAKSISPDMGLLDKSEGTTSDEYFVLTKEIKERKKLGNKRRTILNNLGISYEPNNNRGISLLTDDEFNNLIKSFQDGM